MLGIRLPQDAERHAGRWSVVQISDLGNNTHAIAVKIFDFGNSEPLPTVICNFVQTTRYNVRCAQDVSGG